MYRKVFVQLKKAGQWNIKGGNYRYTLHYKEKRTKRQFRRAGPGTDNDKTLISK